MVTFRRFPASFLLGIASLLVAASAARGQVTTATLYGVVQDTSRAVLPANPAAHVGHTMLAIGFLVRDGAVDGVNVVSLEMLSPSCER
jgi:hypothetical protein